MPFLKYNGTEFISDDVNETMVVVADPSAWGQATVDDVFYLPDESLIPMDLPVTQKDGKPVTYYSAAMILLPIILGGMEVKTEDKNHQLVIDTYFGRVVSGGGAKRQTLLERITTDPKLAPPTIDKNGFYINHDTWFYLMRNVLRRKHTLLIGETGGGKTELAQLIAATLGINFNDFDMAITNPHSTLCGKVHAENATTRFVRARFSLVVEQEHQFILLDEISRAAPSATNILLPVLDSRRKLYIEDDNTIVKIPDSNVFFGTANIGASYSGTYQLDGALFDRFEKVDIPYLPIDILTKLLMMRCEIPERVAKRIAQIALKIRDENLSSKISTRESLAIGDLVADGYSIAAAFEHAVLTKFDGGEGGNGEREQVRSFIQSVA